MRSFTIILLMILLLNMVNMKPVFDLIPERKRMFKIDKMTLAQLRREIMKVRKETLKDIQLQLEKMKKMLVKWYDKKIQLFNISLLKLALSCSIFYIFTWIWKNKEKMFSLGCCYNQVRLRTVSALSLIHRWPDVLSTNCNYVKCIDVTISIR